MNLKKDIAMERTQDSRYDLKRDENFAQTSINFLRRRRKNRVWAAVIVAVVVGLLLLWGGSVVLRSLSGAGSGWLAPVLIGWVVLRFIRRVLAAFFSALIWIIVILALSGLL